MNARASAIDSGDYDAGIAWFMSDSKSKYDKSLIATFLQCQTELASHLCIHSPVDKLTREVEYSIGGTYNKAKEEFWFFGSTSLCHGNNYLLKLFVVTRRDMRFSLFLPKIGHNLTDQIKVNEAAKYSEITGPTKEYIFSTSKKDDIVFIKAYRFTKNEIQSLGNSPLLLPCAIEIHTSYKVHPDIINRIKLQYTVQLNEALYRTRNEGDFIIESATHKKYPVHLFVAAAHSPVLREIIKDKKKTFFLNLSDEDVEMVIGFLYNGSVENLSAKNAPKILMLADMMGLPGMFQLGQIALAADINEDNAVQIAVLAKKYNLKDLSLKVFNFIKQNPEILLSSSIQSLNDIDLMRSILQHVGNARCHQCSVPCEQKKVVKL